MASLEDIALELRRFAADRDWEKFHTTKNLLLALVGEVGELAAELQWLTEEEILEGGHDGAIADELADVALYLIRLSDVLKVDLSSAIHKKLAENASKYPVEKARGRSLKYDKLS